jgi:hypothetical protein
MLSGDPVAGYLSFVRKCDLTALSLGLHVHPFVFEILDAERGLCGAVPNAPSSPGFLRHLPHQDGELRTCGCMSWCKQHCRLSNLLQACGCRSPEVVLTFGFVS